MSASTLEFAAAGFRAMVSPALGATVMRLVWTGPDGVARDLLHSVPARPADGSTRSRFGVWPMVPFANRAFGGVMDDGEVKFIMPVNDGAGGTIHGFGWEAAWDVTEHAGARLVLAQRRAGGPDPFRYLAQLTLALLDGNVRLSLSITNEADLALPFGLGLHPWFPATPRTTITFAARGELALGEGYRPRGFNAWQAGGPYAAGATRPAGAEIAHSIVGWAGQARIDNPDLGLSVGIDASPNLRHPVLWSPKDAAFVCFEPQSHGIGAPSEGAARAVTPLQRLQPGETLAGWMTLRPELL